LQDLEKLKPGDAGKAVAVDRNLFLTVNDINVVPGSKRACDLGMRFGVSGTQVG
jgi:hypothetical protein